MNAKQQIVECRDVTLWSSKSEWNLSMSYVNCRILCLKLKFGLLVFFACFFLSIGYVNLRINRTAEGIICVAGAIIFVIFAVALLIPSAPRPTATAASPGSLRLRRGHIPTFNNWMVRRRRKASSCPCFSYGKSRSSVSIPRIASFHGIAGLRRVTSLHSTIGGYKTDKSQ